MTDNGGSRRRWPWAIGLLGIIAVAIVGVLLTRQEATAVVQRAEADMAPLPADASIYLRLTAPDGAERVLSGADLEALGLWTADTSAYWPNDTGPFTGPRLADVLAAGGLAEAEAVRIAAADDYSIVMPREDWTTWPVLLATRKAGQPITVENKGPLRVIYPRDMDPVLEERLYGTRSPWMVVSVMPADADDVTR